MQPYRSDKKSENVHISADVVLIYALIGKLVHTHELQKCSLANIYSV